MASIFPVYFYINTSLRSIVSTPAGTSVVSSVTLRRGDQLPVYVELNDGTSSLVSRTLSGTGTLNLSAKYDKDWDGFTVFSVTSFSSATFSRTAGASSATVTYYRGLLDLSGTTLSNLFVPRNTSQVTLQAEFRWIDALSGVTYKLSSRPFKFLIQNEVTQ